MKHRISAKAICPHYRHEDSQVIYCDGLQDGTVIHLAFANRADSLEYKRGYCQCGYEECPVHRMLEGLWQQQNT